MSEATPAMQARAATVLALLTAHPGGLTLAEGTALLDGTLTARQVHKVLYALWQARTVTRTVTYNGRGRRYRLIIPNDEGCKDA